MPDKHSFHVVLSNGTERDVTGDDAKVLDSGALVISNASGDAVVIYGAGAWAMVEHERRDDRG